MAKRMGKTADDQYMGGGTGNWSRAPKKKAEVKKTTTTRSAPPKAMSSKDRRQARTGR